MWQNVVVYIPVNQTKFPPCTSFLHVSSHINTDLQQPDQAANVTGDAALLQCVGAAMFECVVAKRANFRDYLDGTVIRFCSAGRNRTNLN